MAGLLQTKEAFKSLVERLRSIPIIERYGPEEAETLAHAFSDIEESLHRFLDQQLPKLADPSVQGEQLEDLLLDVREEFRHVLYHLHDPEFFRLLEPTHAWLTLADPGQTRDEGT